MKKTVISSVLTTLIVAPSLALAGGSGYYYTPAPASVAAPAAASQGCSGAFSVDQLKSGNPSGGAVEYLHISDLSDAQHQELINKKGSRALEAVYLKGSDGCWHMLLKEQGTPVFPGSGSSNTQSSNSQSTQTSTFESSFTESGNFGSQTAGDSVTQGDSGVVTSFFNPNLRTSTGETFSIEFLNQTADAPASGSVYTINYSEMTETQQQALVFYLGEEAEGAQIVQGSNGEWYIIYAEDLDATDVATIETQTGTTVATEESSTGSESSDEASEEEAATTEEEESTLPEDATAEEAAEVAEEAAETATEAAETAEEAATTAEEAADAAEEAAAAGDVEATEEAAEEAAAAAETAEEAAEEATEAAEEATEAAEEATEAAEEVAEDPEATTEEEAAAEEAAEEAATAAEEATTAAEEAAASAEEAATAAEEAAAAVEEVGGEITGGEEGAGESSSSTELTVQGGEAIDLTIIRSAWDNGTAETQATQTITYETATDEQKQVLLSYFGEAVRDYKLVKHNNKWFIVYEIPENPNAAYTLSGGNGVNEILTLSNTELRFLNSSTENIETVITFDELSAAQQAQMRAFYGESATNMSVSKNTGGVWYVSLN